MRAFAVTLTALIIITSVVKPASSEARTNDGNQINPGEPTHC
jgi:hypothetical protein